MNVNDINDNTPTFPRDYEGPFDVTEGQPGPRVWTFLAHDRDSGPNGQVEYSLVAGDPLGEQGLDARWGGRPPGSPTHSGEAGREVSGSWPTMVDLALSGPGFPVHQLVGISSHLLGRGVVRIT